MTTKPEQLSLPGALLPSDVDLCGCHPSDPAGSIIRTMHDAGLTRTTIAHRLNAAAVPSPRGALWHPETVARTIDRAGWNAYMRRYRAEQSARRARAEPRRRG
jgi:hypothetical protein